MKKPDWKKKEIKKRISDRRSLQDRIRSRRNKNIKFLKQYFESQLPDKELMPEEQAFKKKFDDWGKERKKFLKFYYGKVPFVNTPRAVNIDFSFGIEHNSNKFFEIAQQLTKGFPRRIDINLHECERLWPSGVMLLASYHHWFQLKGDGKQEVNILSKNDTNTSAYFVFSGLKKYVTLKDDDQPIMEQAEKTFNNDEIVSLKRETTKDRYQERFEEIIELIRKYSSFDEEELELFQDRILNELFINLSEHGVNYRSLGYNSSDLGWFLISQVHKTSGFITLCLADNGIGVSNSLRTGPQGKMLSKELNLLKLSTEKAEEKLLRKSLEKDVSGAYDAELYKRYVKLIKQKKKGRSRGMGFSRIITASTELDVQFSILSNNGFLKFDKKGGIETKGFKDKIFVGTMFNLIIPIKKEMTNDSTDQS